MVPVHCFFLKKSRDIDTVWTKWIDEHEENVLSRVSHMVYLIVHFPYTSTG
jgi:hypothetical protein